MSDVLQKPISTVSLRRLVAALTQHWGLSLISESAVSVPVPVPVREFRQPVAGLADKPA